jgi:hypothetical protein
VDSLHPFMLGVIATASAAVGAFFFRFWRRTRDELFLAFAAAFALMAANWTIQAFVSRDESYYEVIYLLRLAAFGVIIAGVVRKNRPASLESGPLPAPPVADSHPGDRERVTLGPAPSRRSLPTSASTS